MHRYPRWQVPAWAQTLSWTMYHSPSCLTSAWQSLQRCTLARTSFSWPLIDRRAQGFRAGEVVGAVIGFLS